MADPVASAGRFRCVRFRCDLAVSECVKMQERQIERCNGCVQGAAHALAAGVVVKIRVRPKCRGPQCDHFAERNGLCMGHRKQVLMGYPLAPLRPYRRKVTA